MSDDDRGTDPGTVFGPLKSRPTPELDGEELWQRTAAQLTPRPARPPWWQRLWRGGIRGAAAAGPAPARARAMAAAALVLVLVVGGALIFRLAGPVAPGADGTEAGRLVVLGSSGDGPGAAANPGALPGSVDEDQGEPPAGEAPADEVALLREDLRLQVRLIRGWNGEPPADVQPPGALGAGGADALADVRSQVEGLLAYRSYGLTGRWQGTPGEELRQGIELATGTRMQIAALTVVRDAGTVSVDLVGLRLRVDGEELTTPRLRLVPGRVYLLGLPEERQSRGPSRVLALQAEFAEAPGRP